LQAAALSTADLAELEAHGITPEAASRQLRLYAEPPPPARLVRACAPGDGIRVLGEDQAGGYAHRYDEHARSMRVAKFVPASGAASRMFKSLLAVLSQGRLRTRAEVEAAAAGGDADAKAVATFVARLDDFAFRDALAAALARDGIDIESARENDVPRLLSGLLHDGGLGYASMPKGLLLFHRANGEVRTPFEEHLVEAAQYARGAGDVARLHFTVSPEHEPLFRGLLDEVREKYERRFAVRYEVEFSQQKPSTDTIAVDPDGRPFRMPDGSLLLRPAGHGALIENLADSDADLLFIKNIDNVAVEHYLRTTVLWKRALAGVLLELRDEVFAHRRAIETGGEPAVGAALEFLRETFGTAAPEAIAPDEIARFAAEALDRPLRACGMISSDSDPGGGPFWVADENGRASVQIVETSQIDRRNEGQVAILKSARHFNPVDLVCITRDWKGRPYDLSRFIDTQAVFIAEKSQDGRPLRSLERPGLWNGAMAGWNSVFVEVSADTFHPVKTVNDLLDPAHQG
jgi:hypothetical protein